MIYWLVRFIFEKYNILMSTYVYIASFMQAFVLHFYIDHLSKQLKKKRRKIEKRKETLRYPTRLQKSLTTMLSLLKLHQHGLDHMKLLTPTALAVTVKQNFHLNVPVMAPVLGTKLTKIGVLQHVLLLTTWNMVLL